MILVATLGIAMGASTRAAYSDVSTGADNQFTAGSVAVGDSDAGDLMFSMQNVKPGASGEACITVTYSGSLPASLRLHGITSGTGLDPYLTLTVTRGTFSAPAPQFASCTNFIPDPVDHIGGGSGVIYSGTLAGYPDSYSAGLVDPVAGSPETWTTSESHVYKLTVTLQDDSAAEGKSATQSFIWEARNN